MAFCFVCATMILCAYDCRIAPRHTLVRGVPTRRSFHWRAPGLHADPSRSRLGRARAHRQDISKEKCECSRVAHITISTHIGALVSSSGPASLLLVRPGGRGKHDHGHVALEVRAELRRSAHRRDQLDRVDVVYLGCAEKSSQTALTTRAVRSGLVRTELGWGHVQVPKRLFGEVDEAA